MSYNLLDEGWIPVLWHDGRAERVGIKTALLEAGKIRQIAATNPMDRVALLRFLLAVLYWCRGNPSSQDEKDQVLAGGGFPPDWFVKLEQERDRFELLGTGHRFYQNHAYAHLKPEHTTAYLVQEVPSGRNAFHFRHTLDLIDGLCPACCAMGLVRLPVFATSGGKGMTAATGKSHGINGKPPAYVVPVGTSLAATLRLSWQKREEDLGNPHWTEDGSRLPTNATVPLLTGLTWRPRSVWLGGLEGLPSICALCGHKAQLIRRCVFDGKGSSKGDGRSWHDPHVVYVTGKDGTLLPLQTRDALGNTDAAAGHWARSVPSVVREKRATATLWIIEFSTVQNDKYLEATEYYIPCSSVPQNDEHLGTLCEQWRRQSLRLPAAVGAAMKPSGRTAVTAESAVASIRPHAETEACDRILASVAAADTAWEEACRQYIPLMETICRSLAPGFTTSAVRRRNQISNTLPDMVPRDTVKTRKPRGKKRGAQ
jgi:hypothetical protein